MAAFNLAENVTARVQDIVDVLQEFSAHHAKLGPNRQDLCDQLDELSEVLETLRDRVKARHEIWQDDGVSGALLHGFASLQGVIVENSESIKNEWPLPTTSEFVEGLRERAVYTYTGWICLACLTAEGLSSSPLSGIVVYQPCEVSVSRLRPWADRSSADALIAASQHIREERMELQDAVPDFESSGAAGAIAIVLNVYKAAIESKHEEEARSRSLTRLVADNFASQGASTTSLWRPASPSTIDDPLDPEGPAATSISAQASSRDRPTSTEEEYNFRPSFVPSVTELNRALDVSRESNSRSSGDASVSTPRTTGSSQPSSSGTGSSHLASRIGSSSIIAFNARDALTNAYLVDPVLGSDGLIHDRWSLLEASSDIVANISILGDVLQLREAVHAANPSRKAEFGLKRAAYRRQAIEACISTDNADMLNCIQRLSSVLQWNPDDVEIRTRRALLNYRLRSLKDAKDDLDVAIKTSKQTSLVQLPNLDSLRYRSLALAEMRDVEGALADIDSVIKQTEADPLTLSLRATIRAGKGEFEAAQGDLEEVKKALETGGGSQSMLADENRDLDLIAKGWAHSSLGEIESAVQAFEMAQSLRPFDPYNVACLGIALVHQGLYFQGPGQADEGSGQKKVEQGLSELTSAVMVVSRSKNGEDLAVPGEAGNEADPEVQKVTMPHHAYDPFFLRGMANFALQRYQEALCDFDIAQKVRPKVVKDTGEFYCVLAILQAETGQYDAAVRSFDYAMALKPEERDNYFAKRSQYGL